MYTIGNTYIYKFANQQTYTSNNHNQMKEVHYSILFSLMFDHRFAYALQTWLQKFHQYKMENKEFDPNNTHPP